jgi:YtkA-like
MSLVWRKILTCMWRKAFAGCLVICSAQTLAQTHQRASMPAPTSQMSRHLTNSVDFSPQDAAPKWPSKQAGKYQVSLRLPEDALVAGEEQEIEFRVVDTSRTDPVLGPAAVIRAVIQSTVAMPSMPSMPKVEEIAHPEGVPGDYGLHPTFAHGGDYLLSLKIAPPAGEPFAVEFPLKVADEIPNRKARIKPYRIDLKTDPGKVKAGEAVKLRFMVWANRETRDAEGRPAGRRQLEQVKQFDVAHEKLLHLIVARKDLGFFSHQHPDLQPDGSFLLTDFAFPGAGEYQLFADIAPKGAGAQVLLATLKVEGKTKPAETPLATAERATEQTVAGVRVAFKGGAALSPKKTSLFTITLRRAATGDMITDLQPYLGAMGHMMMIHEDAQTFVHSHPDERDPNNGKQGDLTFLARPPKPGLYRLWIEFQRGDQINRAEFTVEVKESGNANNTH